MGPPKPPSRAGGKEARGTEAGRERTEAVERAEGKGPGQRAARSTFTQNGRTDPAQAASSHATNSTNLAAASNVGQRAPVSSSASSQENVNRNRPQVIYDRSFQSRVETVRQKVTSEYIRLLELQQGVEHPPATDVRVIDAIDIEATRRVIEEVEQGAAKGNGNYGNIPAFKDAPNVSNYDAANSPLANTIELRNLLRLVPPEHMKELLAERGPLFRDRVVKRYSELDKQDHDDDNRDIKVIEGEIWQEALRQVEAEVANHQDVRRVQAGVEENRSGQVEQLAVEVNNEGKSRVREAIDRNPKKFVTLVVGLVIVVLGGIGALSWYFNRARATAPKAKDLDKKNNRVLDPPVTIGIAELIETANPDARIQLSGPDPKSVLKLGVGTWTTDGLTVTFKPDAAFNFSPASVKFILIVPETANEFGAQSEEKTITLTFAANAQDVTLTDQVRGVVNIPIPAGSSTVALPGADASTGKVTVAGKGEWSVKDLTVTFTPAPGFDYSTISTPFTLTTGTAITQATISLSFQSATTMVKQPPLTLSFYGNYNKPVTIHVNQATGVTGKVVFNDNSTMKMANEGTWIISGGELKFTANSSFTGAKVSVDYKIEFAPGSFSNSAKMTIVFNKPTASDVMKDTRFLEQGIAADADVVASASLPSPAHMDDLKNVDTVNPTSIDPKSVIILGFSMMDTGSTPPAGSMELTGKALIAIGEGTWLVSEADGSIWFSPEKGFTGNPTPIFYTLSDNQGNRADAKRVVFLYNISLDPAVISIPDDDKFWGLFKRLVINHMPPLSDMELIAQLTLQRNILSTMFQNIAKPRGLNDYIAAKDLYVAGNYTTLALYDACLKIPVEQPGTTGPHSPFWDRYYRLDLMTDLLQQHINKQI